MTDGRDDDRLSKKEIRRPATLDDALVLRCSDAVRPVRDIGRIAHPGAAILEANGGLYTAGMDDDRRSATSTRIATEGEDRGEGWSRNSIQR